MFNDILHQQSQAESCLSKTRIYLQNKTVKADGGWGLQQFLDEVRPGNTYVGVYGTSCGITTLLTCGENSDSVYIQNYKAWLIRQQEKEGGWTLSTFRSRDILTTSTCYVLNALNDADEKFSSPIIQDGLSWLQKTQNPDRGWGLYQNDSISKITPTAHAVITLSRYPQMLRTQTAVEGINWLIKSRNADHGWGQDPNTNSPSTIAHTALCIISLISAGYPAYSSHIQEPLQFLLARLNQEDLLTEDEVFSVHHSDSTVTSTHYHLPATSLVARALLLAGIDPLQQEVVSLIRTIISQQTIEGYWSDKTTPNKIPIWATLYATLALAEFVKRVDSVRDTLGIRQVMIDLSQTTRASQEQLRNISLRLDSLEKQVKPISKSLLFLRKYRIFIFLAIAVVVYIAFLLSYDIPQYVNIAGAIFGALFTVLGMIDSRQNSK